jgi:hypothetical protein
LTPLKGLLDDEAVETFRQATDPLAGPHPEHNGVKDDRSPALRLAQAHLAALRGYLDAGDGPTVGGQVPSGTKGPGTAQILPLVVNGKSQVIDVGREQRLFTPNQRRVLAGPRASGPRLRLAGLHPPGRLEPGASHCFLAGRRTHRHRQWLLALWISPPTGSPQ